MINRLTSPHTMQFNIGKSSRVVIFHWLYTIYKWFSKIESTILAWMKNKNQKTI
jgi:hypothetical protein